MGNNLKKKSTNNNQNAEERREEASTRPPTSSRNSGTENATRLSPEELKKIAEMELEIFNAVLNAKSHTGVRMKKEPDDVDVPDNDGRLLFHSKDYSQMSSIILNYSMDLAEELIDTDSSINLSILAEKMSCDAFVAQSETDVNAENVKTPQWDYNRIDKWPKQCLGQNQSPINIVSENVIPIAFPRFLFKNFLSPEAAAISNNGHTVTVKFIRGDEILVAGGGLPGIYRLDNIHFHWESEHTINGKKYPLEIHMVFFDNSVCTLSDAAKKRKIMILTSFAKGGIDSIQSFETVADSVGDIIVPDRGFYVSLKKNIIVNEFLPTNKSTYYRYYGSLTSPDCNEGVLWTIFPTPIELSVYSIKTLKKIKGLNGEVLKSTSRPVQPLNNRTVFYKNKSENY